MDTKISCLAHFLEKDATSIHTEDDSLHLYRYEEKVYKIMNKRERLDEYNDYLIDNLYNLPHNFLSSYLFENLPRHMDVSEFRDYFFDLITDLGENSNLLILSRIDKLENFVSDSLKYNEQENLGKIFAEKDAKEHYSQAFQCYLYRVE